MAAALQQIDLVNQRIYAYHGCMEEEAIIGSEYVVNVSVWADLTLSAKSDDLHDTVDYVALRQIVSQEMAIRAKLLETVARRILDRIHADLPQIARAEVAVSKLNPPIDGDVEAVCVRFRS